jgi:TRAP-type C4-dicarboxylate transport system substrate-binding protein
MKLASLAFAVTLAFAGAGVTQAQTTMRISISIAQNSHQGVAIDVFARAVE